MKKALLFTLIIILVSFVSFSQKKSVVWSDDLEGDWTSRWYSDFGVWQVGTPTIGPGSAHGGTNCAAVGLNANYPDGFTSRLIRMDYFTIPGQAQQPRLRFFHWWNDGSYDYGAVQIQEQGGTDWIKISPEPQFTGTGGNIWNHAFIDLSPYAGKTVKFAFYFESKYGGESSGWFIDDITIETGPLPFSNPEDFEGGFGNWYNDFGSWQIGTPAVGPLSGHLSDNCAAVGLTDNYVDGFSSRLISPYLTIPDSNIKPRLRFWHWWSNGSYDYGAVQIQEQGGTDWIKISPEPQFTGTGGNIWNHAFIDLSPYAGKTVKFAFYFESKYGGESSGWFIDNITIETGPLPFSNPEDFENGFGNWYNDFGSWQIGTPTLGPLSGHLSDNCAAVGLTDNYVDGFSSRLISPEFTIDNSSAQPSLRFWHWWNTGSYDFGEVQIQISGSTTWTPISSQYTGTGGSIWNFAFIDLTSFLGKKVKLGFYFESKYGGEGPGWYIDDIVLPIDSVDVTGTVTDPIGNPISTGNIILFNNSNYYGGYDTTDVATIVNGNYTTKTPANYPSIVLAMPQSSQVTEMIPTYFGDADYWIDADTVQISSNTNIGTIHFIAYPPMQTGNATVQGTVLGTLQAKANDPIDNVGVIIKKKTNGAIHGYVRTGVDGSFSIQNLETGDYTIWVDYPGIPMYPLNGDNDISINKADTMVQITARVDSAFVRIKPLVPGIEDNSRKNLIMIYPNPTSGTFTLAFENPGREKITVCISKVDGRMVYSNDFFSGNNNYFKEGIDLKNLMKGIYFVKVQTGKFVEVKSIIVE